MLADISEGRGITIDNLNAIADTLGGRSPRLAKDSGLIDGAIFYDEYEDRLRMALSVNEENDYNSVSLEDYLGRSNKRGNKTGKDKIAVIFAQGEILYGEGGKR